MTRGPASLPALLLAAGAASAECAKPELIWQAAALSQASQWTELAPSGQTRVRESGRLGGWADVCRI